MAVAQTLTGKEVVKKKTAKKVEEPFFFSTMIRDARRDRGLTLRELSAKVECAPSFLSELENGLRAAPKDVDVLKRIADGLELSYEALCKAADNEKRRRDVKPLRDLFIKDDKLASLYCRVQENWNEDIVKLVLWEAFKKYHGGGNVSKNSHRRKAYYFKKKAVNKHNEDGMKIKADVLGGIQKTYGGQV
jgi:transcriptional regulator with XRE-family HTH domain